MVREGKGKTSVWYPLSSAGSGKKRAFEPGNKKEIGNCAKSFWKGAGPTNSFGITGLADAGGQWGTSPFAQMMGRPPKFRWEEEAESGLEQENPDYSLRPPLGAKVKFTSWPRQRREQEGLVLAWGQGNTVLVGTPISKHWVSANQTTVFQKSS